jgi:histidinol dehydrogenase
VTSNASQSKTVDIPIVALGSESFATANREQIYVSLSRGREAVRVYTDDKEAMMDAIKRSSARLSATELMQGEEAMPARKPGVIRRAFERIQVAHRSYKQKLARLVAWDAVHKQQGEGRSLGR